MLFLKTKCRRRRRRRGHTRKLEEELRSKHKTKKKYQDKNRHLTKLPSDFYYFILLCTMLLDLINGRRILSLSPKYLYFFLAPKLLSFGTEALGYFHSPFPSPPHLLDYTQTQHSLSRKYFIYFIRKIIQH